MHLSASKCMYLSFILLFKFSLFVYVVDQASDIESGYILSQIKSDDDHCAYWMVIQCFVLLPISIGLIALSKHSIYISVVIY